MPFTPSVFFCLRLHCNSDVIVQTLLDGEGALEGTRRIMAEEFKSFTYSAVEVMILHHKSAERRAEREHDVTKFEIGNDFSSPEQQ